MSTVGHYRSICRIVSNWIAGWGQDSLTLITFRDLGCFGGSWHSATDSLGNSTAILCSGYEQARRFCCCVAGVGFLVSYNRWVTQ